RTNRARCRTCWRRRNFRESRGMILVCGEALIDLFVGPAEGAEMPARAVAGGSPFNVAIGLARLGVDAAILGGISRDRFGALLARMLIGEGIDDRFLVRTDRP